MTGLLQLKHSSIIHCDLKPENILFTDQSHTNLKIIDLGSACRTYQEGFTYVQSRFYRSPEIVLGLPYDHQVDMWSFGCILVELVTGEPLFPAVDENDLLALIRIRIGEPSLYMIQQAQKRDQLYIFDGYHNQYQLRPSNKRNYNYPIEFSQRASIDELLGDKMGSDFIDFVKKCLIIDNS